MIFRILALVVVSSISALGQTSSTAQGVRIHVGSLQASVRYNTSATQARIRHPAARSHPDTLVRHDVLRYIFYAPQQGSFNVTVFPASLQSHVSVERVGGYGGRQTAFVTIDPFVALPSGRLTCTDSLSVSVSWLEALVPSAIMLPPVSAPFLNPGWAPKPMLGSAKRSAKMIERLHGGVNPSLWYDASFSYARVETRYNGVAVLLAQDVLQHVPALNGSDTSQLVLYWRGVEQPLAIIDADGSATFSIGDSIIFVGKHAQGDTTYLDLQDTTAVFFLTARTGLHKRISERPSSPGAFQKLRSLIVQERIELDTGYYHPGSDDNVDYSTFVTPMTLFEGFYWETLNARAEQYSTHNVYFTPSGEGTVSITADVVSSTNAPKYNPDHAIDVSINGGSIDGVIGEGYQRYELGGTTPGNGMPACLQSVRVFATGIPSLASTPDWFSEVLLDAIEIKGLSASVLDNGRLRGRANTASLPMNLVVDNAPPGTAMVIDTTAKQWTRLSQGERGVSVRCGIAPEAQPWPTMPAPSKQYNVTVGFEDDHRSLQLTRGYVVAQYFYASRGIVINQTQDSMVCAALIAATDESDIVVVYGAGAVMTNGIRNALQGRKSITTYIGDTLWVVASKGNESNISSSATTTEPTRGIVFFGSSSQALRGRVETSLPASYGGVLVIGSGPGIERARIRAASLGELGADSSRVDVFVITPASLRAQAQRWSDFRGRHNKKAMRVVDVDYIFDEFDAGRHSPEAIRLYLKQAWEKAPLPKPTHCVIIGNASWDVRLALKDGNTRSVRPDLVPTYGKPSSDYWFGLLDDPSDVAVPELIVSRFPVLTTSECAAVVDKIIATDSAAYQPWMRRFMYVGGGESESDGLCKIYQDRLSDPFETGILYTDPPLCIDTVTVCKSVTPNPGLEIRRQLNSGAGMMSYIGHGGTEIFDIKGWDPEDLSNKGKYPVLGTYSCLTGAFSNPSALCLNGQYLIQPQAGFVAALGASGWQYLVVVSHLLLDLHEVLRETSIREIGQLTYSAKLGLSESTLQYNINAAMQFNILGDPFTRIEIDTSTQVSIAPPRVVITSPSGDSQLREDNDSAYVDVTVWSEGTGSHLPYVVQCIHQYGTSLDTLSYTVVDGPCREHTMRFVIKVQGKVGLNNLDVEVDPNGSMGDRREDNRVKTPFQVYARALLILEPDPFGVVRSSMVSARIIDILSQPTNTMKIDMAVSTSQDTATAVIRALPSELVRQGSIVDWRTKRRIEMSRSFSDLWLGAWATDTATHLRTAIAWMPIRVVSDYAPATTDHSAGVVHASDVSPTLDYDVATNTLRLSTYSRDVFVRSSGIMTSDPDRDPILSIKVGQNTILENSFRTGINIVVLGQRDTVPRLIRRYDTSKNPAPIETGHSGFARECIAFLRDSIASSDRVVIAACNESFSRFITDNYMDSLRVQLRALGSRLCDSLDLASSFAFIGSRTTASSLASESWKGAPDYMVTTDSSVKFHYATGASRSAMIGPARRWSALSYRSAGIVQGTLYGLLVDGTEVVLDTALRWMPSDGAPNVSHVYYQWQITGTENVPEASVGDVEASFEPLSQWIIESDGMNLDKDTVLRGEPVTGHISIRNARTSFTSPVSVLKISAIDTLTGFEVSAVQRAVTPIEPNAYSNVSFAMPTSQFSTNVRLIAILDPENDSRELFAVLDRCEDLIAIREDNTKPLIEPYVDNRFLPSGGWVHIEPFIEIRLRDESPLPILDPERLVIFVNGLRIRATSAGEYSFLGSLEAQAQWPGSDIRAAMRFRIPLDLGDNLLIVRATDASNNSDTLEIPLLTSAETRLESVTLAPNPSSGPVIFTVALVAPSSSSAATITIYDVQGRSIRTLPVTITVGQATVTWDGKGDAGEVLASGVYAWRLNILNASGIVDNTTNGTLVVRR